MRRLTGLDMLAIGVNSIVGSGVFSLPDDMARAMGHYSPLAFLLCALLLMPVAMCFSELATSYDRSGGPYAYAYDAFGARVGFVIGWMCWVNAFISFATNAGLMAALVGFQGWPARAVIVASVLSLAALNHVGVKPGALLVKVLVGGKLAAIACFVIAAVVQMFRHTPVPLSASPEVALSLTGVANGVYLALFPFQGFEVVPVPAGEVKDPKRAIPMATMGSLLLSAVLYVVVQFLLVQVYPNLAAESETPLVNAAIVLGPAIGSIILVGSLVSVGGFTAGSALGAPRYAQAMAQAGQLPQKLGVMHPRFGTPHWAIWITSIIAALLAASFSYRSLVGFSNLSVVLQYAATCAALIVLRARDKIQRNWWAQCVPYLGVLASLSFIYGANLDEMLFASGALVLGLVLWFAKGKDRPMSRAMSTGV